MFIWSSFIQYIFWFNFKYNLLSFLSKLIPLWHGRNKFLISLTLEWICETRKALKNTQLKSERFKISWSVIFLKIFVLCFLFKYWFNIKGNRISTKLTCLEETKQFLPFFVFLKYNMNTKLYKKKQIKFVFLFSF